MTWTFNGIKDLEALNSVDQVLHDTETQAKMKVKGELKYVDYKPVDRPVFATFAVYVFTTIFGLFIFFSLACLIWFHLWR